MLGKGYSGIGIFAGSQLLQSGIDIPASGQSGTAMSRSSPALPSFVDQPLGLYTVL
jgi:hypothetical protein